MGDAGPKEEIFTFDQLLRRRAIDEDQTALLAYPKSKYGVDDYELVNGEALNRFVDGAAKALIEKGFKPVEEETLVGIFAPSDLDYVITIYGLGRLGYVSFLLSPRLPASAVSSLLSTCKSQTLLYGPDNSSFAESVGKLLPGLHSLPILTRSEYYSKVHTSTPQFERKNVDFEKEHLRTYMMVHSSGSTGLPKPIRVTNKRLTVTFITATALTGFQSVPFNHVHGLVTYTQHIYIKKTLYLMNGHVPQTHDTVTAAIKAANPGIIWTVPYVLKLLAEKQDGIDVLKKCEIVSSSGSRCPDDLGDLLASQGVFIGLTFGSSETAVIFSSLTRPRGDTAWNYMRVMPHVKPYLLMRPVDGEICEAIVLDGHKSKAATNSDDPPNSFHTSDLFVEHPMIRDAWKFVGRLDDRITLLNGEKVLPLPIEGRIRQHAWIREAVMFGIDKPVPGLLLFKSGNATNLDDEQFLDEVWPTIHEANTQAEGFSQISRDMVVIVGSDVDCPSTDKSSIKRAQVYRDFADEIEEVYIRMERQADGPLLQLSQKELETWILERFQELDVNIPNAEADFFTSGVDSLKAIQMRGLIVRHIDVGDNTLGSMVVYDCGTIRNLAKRLQELRQGSAAIEDEDGKELKLMESLIERFSAFDVPVGDQTIPRDPLSHEGNVVILTGATGSLGSHILIQLVSSPNVTKIYCLIRPSGTVSAQDRLASALRDRMMPLDLSKVTAISSDVSARDLGISSGVLSFLGASTTHIIHCAWVVNFALPVSSFESQLQSLQNLLAFTLSQSDPARLLFCSSIGVATSSPPLYPAIVPESPIPDLRHASPTGYARSKLIGEKIVENAVIRHGARATVLRIGQIVPSKEVGSGVWNVNEAIPLIVRSAAILGVLPNVLGPGGEDVCTWLEADVLARCIVELADVEGGPVAGEQVVYNLVNPSSFSWREEFLPALKAAGLKFDVLSWEDWLEKVEAEEDIEMNPSRKLLGFWSGKRRVGEQGTEGEIQREVKFETKEAVLKSKALRNAPRVVDGDLVGRLVEAWKEVW
ncbi:related to nonribosomal peptide synthetase MxcG (component of the myxochelin iron transport regul [Phialocephala subalpina]|uniref:Related to nonribosomal peptide synthetase MxcG (component of the myxochelin iron transport regul) n=1 Tax=Phialocephala subalpina TaxID=576137 RepID=A0A1L7WQM3_9HELO|nr:related to nonribosomal peptide synthetase MxcG (component of the myxochelin iron transport regul [Phialocephala subalpina]